MDSKRLERQIAFVLEIDKLKSVIRRTFLVNQSRHENSAEHSWHLALMAMVLAEHANEELDGVRVMRMVLIHDLVEIDAGDTYAYAETDRDQVHEREQHAAERIFSLLPADQREDLMQLWEEFDAGETPESRFAGSLDRLMPMLHNYHTQGRSWKEHGVTAEQVRVRMAPIREGSEVLGDVAEDLIRRAIEEGILPEKEQGA